MPEKPQFDPSTNLRLDMSDALNQERSHSCPDHVTKIGNNDIGVESPPPSSECSTVEMCLLFNEIIWERALHHHGGDPSPPPSIKLQGVHLIYAM